MNIKKHASQITRTNNKKHTKHTTFSKHTTRIILAIFALTLLVTPQTTKTTIPEIKGVYELFSPDVIGIGQALRTKGWIENVYDFAPDKNPAKEVIKVLWNKLNENSNFVLSGLPPTTSVNIDDFCEILNYIQTLENDKIAIKKAEDEKKKELNKNETLKRTDYEKIKKNQELKNKKKRDSVIEKLRVSTESRNVKHSKSRLETLLKELANLKNSEDFIPETAEAILWAFFEEKFTTAEGSENNFKTCLDKLKHKEIDFTKYHSENYYIEFEDYIKQICNKVYAK